MAVQRLQRPDGMQLMEMQTIFFSLFSFPRQQPERREINAQKDTANAYEITIKSPPATKIGGQRLIKRKTTCENILK